MSGSPRWKKIFADIWHNKTRTLLVALSIAIGIFAVGFVATSFLILRSDIPADYFTANPHTAILYTDPFDDGLLDAVRKIDGVAQAEGRGAVSAKLEGLDGSTNPVQITRYPSLAETQIDQLRLEQGAAVLGPREVYLERQVASKLGYQVGDTLQVTLMDGSAKELTIAGIVQAVTGTHFLYTHVADVYTNAETLTWLGGPELYTQLIFTVNQNEQDKVAIRALANTIGEKLRGRDLQVYTTEIPNPGETPNQTILNALLALMAGLGILSLVLSIILVYNTISAFMSQQICQIGVMKALGATMGQLAAIYMVLVLAFGLIALVAAVPVSAAGAYGLCVLISKMMNVNLTPFHLPLEALVLQFLIGVGVPLLGALLPVLNGTRLTIREAISSYGLSTQGKANGLDRLLESIRGLPRPLMLSLRNTFRRKGRLILTLAMLTLGGTIFVSVFSVRDAIYQVLDQTFGYSLSDVNIRLDNRYSIAQLQKEIGSIPGIVSLEGWGHEMADVLDMGGKNGDTVEIQAPPVEFRLDPTCTDQWTLAAAG